MADLSADDDALRARLRQALEGGLETEWRERADDSAKVSRVVARLAALRPQEHEERLRIAGFTPAPYVAPGDDSIEQACASCMYYVVHRRFCDLPELRLPVQPEWSCRLWRI